MKYLILFIFTLNTAFAGTCDWSTIKQNADGSYVYPKEIHLCVGKLVKDNEDLTQEVSLLRKSIELKDLAIDMHTRRADVWMNTSFKLEEKVNTMESLKNSNYFLYFGLGILTMGLATWGVSNLR